MYNHQAIEKKWQKKWKTDQTFRFVDSPEKEKIYVLDMFPYPSAKGLHVGHPKGYVATDVISRYYRLKGYSVLHPIGWDAFGLPAEQFALDSGEHPANFTSQNIENFRRQLNSFGFDFDYDKEVNTTDPKYYQWTQWIFAKLYEHGLAEIQDIDVNWCEKLKCVLSNEEVVVNLDGVCVSERGNFPVIKRPMRQWVLKISTYADKLLEGLNEIDWPESLKAIQRNWIGRSEGVIIVFSANGISLKVFTTRPDTIFGVAFIAISPKHSDLWKYVVADNKAGAEVFLKEYAQKNDLLRKKSKNPTGFFTGSYLIHPFTKKSIPVWISDHVSSDFGVGAIMGVPAHNEDDFIFAQKYNLPINFIIEVKNFETPFLGDGIHVNSDFLNGLNNDQSVKKITKTIIEQGIGYKHTAYKLRDWVFSRQRYWGEPFPVLFDPEKKIHIVSNLPVLLPSCKNIKPSGTGESPLANLGEWMNVEIDNVSYQRDSNTMPQWAGSCWYYLAYIIKNADGSYLPLNSAEAWQRFQRWLPVDVYVGGQEHAVLHLLYARFWHRFLYDIGVVPTKEPFQRVINQGMILGTDGSKMSKSKGNGVNPDEIIKSYGADALRLYEMFMGPITASLPWSLTGLAGMRRWLERVYQLYNKSFDKSLQFISANHKSDYQKLVNNFTKNVENYHFNLCISSMMIFINGCYREQKLFQKYMDDFLILLSCFAPHLAEELYSRNHDESVCLQRIPTIIKDEPLSSWTISVQINGKFCSSIVVNTLSEKIVLDLAKKEPKVKKKLMGKAIVNQIYVSGKVINFLIK